MFKTRLLSGIVLVIAALVITDHYRRKCSVGSFMYHFPDWNV